MIIVQLVVYMFIGNGNPSTILYNEIYVT